MTNLREKKKHPYIDASLTSRSTKSKFLDMLNEKGENERVQTKVNLNITDRATQANICGL